MWVIDATVGGSQSNSYIDVADVSAFADEYELDRTGWDAASAMEKMERLVASTAAVDTLSWKGYKVYKDQALAFPRTTQASGGVVDPAAPPSVIPEFVTLAQVYLALSVDFISEVVQALPSVPSAQVVSTSVVGAISTRYGGREGSASLGVRAYLPYWILLGMSRYIGRLRAWRVGTHKPVELSS